MDKILVLDWISYVLLAIGGINWGLVGMFGFDLVQFIFQKAVLVNAVYAVVGVAGIYALVRIPFK